MFSTLEIVLLILAVACFIIGFVHMALYAVENDKKKLTPVKYWVGIALVLMLIFKIIGYCLCSNTSMPH